MVKPVTLLPGVMLWREKFSRAEQQALMAEVLARLEIAPLYRPRMPGSDKEFSVEESNFGPLGWVSDKSGYRYQPAHPVTGKPWPEVPPMLMELWREIAGYADARMLPCQSLSRRARAWVCIRTRTSGHPARLWCRCRWGIEALFRIGGETRRGPTQSVMLSFRRRGDVRRPGPARLSRHRPHPAGQLLACSQWRPYQSHFAKGEPIKKRPAFGDRA